MYAQNASSSSEVKVGTRLGAFGAVVHGWLGRRRWVWCFRERDLVGEFNEGDRGCSDVDTRIPDASVS